ncbi:MAG: hypothetical protein J5809_06300 [Selenomonadaceae bacterium]|nr:hypothetical protein [Selenomonadaceae bacterium]
MNSARYRKLKKILLATLATTTIFHGTVYAEQSVQPSGTSDNSVEVNEENFSVNGETTAVEEDYDMVYGGGGEENSAASTGNSVTINGGRINGVFGGMSTTGSVRGNRVTINGGNILGGVAGGLAFFPYDGTSAGNVFGNSVIVNGGTIDFVSGGEVAYSYPVDESTPDFSQFQGGLVYNNYVRINGGNITGGINGGAALTGSVTGNTVDIYGGTISGNVIAGEVREPTDSSVVTGNTINIFGTPDLSSANLFGGMLGSSYVAADNTLNINTAGITVNNINFDSFGAINFNIPDSVTNGGTIMTVNEGIGSVDLGKIGLGISGDSQLNTNDKINLIVNGSSSSDFVSGSQDAVISKGVTLLYDANLTSTVDGVTATIGGIRTSDNPTEKANSGDFPEIQTNIPDPFSEAVADIALGIPEESDNDSSVPGNIGVFSAGGFNAFLNTGGGRIKTKTGGGSTVTTKTGSYDLGFARSIGSNQQAGRTYLAPLIEYVHSSYDSNFSNGMRGSGNTKYTAGGIVARQSNSHGTYYEGSLRGGRMKNEFSSDDFIFNGERTHVDYKMSAPVFTGHIRIGNVNRMNRNNVLDVYGIYAYARQNGMGTDLSTGDHVEFSSINSNTIRLGYRMTTRTSTISKIYTGLAYQYDKNSDSTVTSQRYPKTSEGASGSSAILELGWQIRPVRSNPWALDIKAVGWMGFHQGFNVLANMQKSF